MVCHFASVDIAVQEYRYCSGMYLNDLQSVTAGWSTFTVLKICKDVLRVQTQNLRKPLSVVCVNHLQSGL